jgi:SAM-dependent methyltransferase
VSLHEYYEEYWEREAPSPVSDPLASTRLSLLNGRLEEAPQVILDAGCGHGALVNELRSGGHEATGFDISHAALERAVSLSPESHFVQHSAEELPWPVDGASFDAVVAFEVIEHLLRPEALIVGARDVLRARGHLALTTPYHGRLKNVLISLVAFDHHFNPEGDHIRFLSDRALGKMLTRNGFEVEAIQHFGRVAPFWAGVFVWARKR